MTHNITKYDVATDLKRCLYSSLSEKSFADENVVIFLKKAEENLGKIAFDLNENTYKLVNERIEKAKDVKSSHSRRREDLLMASCLLG